MALIHGMGGILSLGKIWTVPFHSALPCEMEQSKFYRAIIFLPFHSKPLTIYILYDKAYHVKLRLPFMNPSEKGTGIKSGVDCKEMFG